MSLIKNHSSQSINFMSNLFSVKGKTIVISGGTGILGKAIASHLAKEGAKIIILGRNPSKVQELVEEIKADGNFAVAAIADVTDENQLLQVQETLSKDFDKIDVLINAAGGNMPGAVVTPDQTLADLSGE